MRTVAATRPDDLTKRPPHPDRQGSCEFCISLTTSGVRHDHCPGEIHTTAPGRKDNKTWTCQCWREGHPS